MDPIASRPPVFLTGANVCNTTRVLSMRFTCSQGIYITPRVPLLPDSAGPHAEPGGGTMLLQQGPASISHNQPQGEGIGNLPPSDIPITDNAPSFDKGTVLEVERRSRTPPKVRNRSHSNMSVGDNVCFSARERLFLRVMPRFTLLRGQGLVEKGDTTSLVWVVTR